MLQGQGRASAEEEGVPLPRVYARGTKSTPRPLLRPARPLARALPARLRGRLAQETLERRRHPERRRRPEQDDPGSRVSRDGLPALPVTEPSLRLDASLLKSAWRRGQRQDQGRRFHSCERASRVDRTSGARRRRRWTLVPCQPDRLRAGWAPRQRQWPGRGAPIGEKFFAGSAALG